jgi:hypothetical protein
MESQVMKKTLIAAATAGLIAAGTMVATTGTASAAGVYFGGPGWSVGVGGPNFGPDRPHQACRPVFKTVRWWDNWGRPHFRNVFVRQECSWNFGPGRGPGRHWDDRGPNPGWGHGGPDWDGPRRH